MDDEDEDTDWTDEGGDEWTRILRGLLLRVTSYPNDPDEPWMWEVLEVKDEDAEYEVATGGAKSREAAMASAEAAALAADEDDEDEEE